MMGQAGKIESITMGNKILEAVKSLGGDLGNCFGGIQPCEMYLHLDCDGDYMPCRKKSEESFVCTVDEFNEASSQWIKEAYMHNAALDLDWDFYNAKSWVSRSDEYIILLDGSFQARVNAEHYNVICTKQEFIDYCNANKPCEEVKPAFTQAMADAGELPPAGSKFDVDGDEGCDDGLCHLRCVGNHIDGGVIGVDESGYLHRIISGFKPIKSARDKAIDEMLSAAINSEDDIAKSIIYEACVKLADAGYRKAAGPKVNRQHLPSTTNSNSI